MSASNQDELRFDAYVALPEAQERFRQAEAERDRYREALKAAFDVLTYSGAMSEATDSPGNMAFAIINHALNGGGS